MMRRALPIAAALVMAVALAPPAHATVFFMDVAVQNFGFNPKYVEVNQGSGVQWQNFDAFAHTSTSDQGFWRSGHIAHGGTYRQVAAFENAGSYWYHCSIHPDMTGRVQVPMKARGTTTTGWKLRWSSLTSTPASRAFDVEIKRPGATTWARYRWDTKSRTAFFNPARNGRYSFRARTRNLSNGKRSGWSPIRSLRIA